MMLKKTTKPQNKVATPPIYYTTANLASSKSISIKSVIPFELAQIFKIKNSDTIFWQKTSDGKMLVWKKKKNEKIPEGARESGKERKKAVPDGESVTNNKTPINTTSTENTQPQIASTTHIV